MQYFFNRRFFGLPNLIESVTDRSGRTISYTYDANERLSAVVSPEEGRTDLKYDPNGNLIAFIDPSRNTTSFEYDLENKMTKRIYADGKYESFQYDNAGLLTQKTDARGIATNYFYDSNYNLINKRYSDDTPWVSYEYDELNRMIKRQDGTGTYDFTYYKDDALHTVDGPVADDLLTYTYDKLGRLKTVSPPTGHGQAIEYTYDDLNRLTGVQTASGNFIYGYTGADPLVQTLTRPNNGAQTVYEYNDPLKRLTALINNDSSAQLINRFDYAYDDPQHPDQRSSETIINGESISFSANMHIWDVLNI